MEFSFFYTHILSKTTFFETDTNLVYVVQIQVAMPRLHPRAEDWLCTPSEPCGQQPAGHSAFSWNIPRSIPQLSDSASSGSLHRWLLDIQNEADNDDDGFELITRSGDQSGKAFILAITSVGLILYQPRWLQCINFSVGWRTLFYCRFTVECETCAHLCYSKNAFSVISWPMLFAYVNTHVTF